MNVLLHFASMIVVALVGVASAAAPTGRSDVTIRCDHTLSEQGSTMATAYAMSNKIVTLGDKTYVAWLDTKSTTRVRVFDRATCKPIRTVELGRGKDNHGGPALTADADENLHIVFGPHHGPFQYRHTTRPGDMDSWSPVTTFGVKCTYPSLVCAPDGTLHLTCRGGDSPCKLHYYRKPKGGDWAGPIALVDAGVPKGYTQYGNPLAVAPDGTLHLGFHIYDFHPKGGKSAGYMKSTDGGKTWTDTKGRKLNLPVTPKTAELIEHGPKLDMRVGNIALDANGRPWLPVIHMEHAPFWVTLWHHDGSAWRATPLRPWIDKTIGEGQHAYGATMTFGGDGTMYIALALMAKGEIWGDISSEIALLTSTDGGKTFTGRMISPPDPTIPNWLPSIERPTGHHRVDVPWLMYTHGHRRSTRPPGYVTEVRLLALGRRDGQASAKAVRIGGVVLKWTPKDRALSYRRLEPMIREAARGGARIVLTTESCLDGYSIRDKEMPIEAFRALAEEIPGGDYAERFRKLADELDIHLVVGLLRRIEDKTYNSAAVFGPDGKLVGIYHKQHLGHEKVRNTAGDACPVFDTPYGKMGVMICADRRYPKVTRGLVAAGAEFILVPSGGMWGPAKNDHHVQARSCEGKLPIIFAHPIEWLVTGPDGTIWDRDFRGHTMDTAEEDLDTIRDQRGVFLFDLPVGRK